MFSKAGERLTKRVRSMMFESMMGQEIGWFDRKENSVGALCARLSSEAASLQGVRNFLRLYTTLAFAIRL